MEQDGFFRRYRNLIRYLTHDPVRSERVLQTILRLLFGSNSRPEADRDLWVAPSCDILNKSQEKHTAENRMILEKAGVADEQRTDDAGRFDPPGTD